MSLSFVESLEDAVTLQSFVADNSVRIEGTTETDTDREPEIDAECLAMIAGDRLNTEDPALATVAAAVVLDQEPPEWARRQLKVGSDDQEGEA
jgi:hypothetical protein